MIWLNSTTSPPLLIIKPFHESEILVALFYSKKLSLQIRVRRGGHDYQGLSYLCETPFVIIDLGNFRSVEINIEEETAWIQSGTTIGELYYAICKQSNIHAFPAGLCPTVGVGGHLSGGGFGTLLSKYGDTGVSRFHAPDSNKNTEASISPRKARTSSNLLSQQLPITTWMLEWDDNQAPSQLSADMEAPCHLHADMEAPCHLDATWSCLIQSREGSFEENQSMKYSSSIGQPKPNHEVLFSH